MSLPGLAFLLLQSSPNNSSVLPFILALACVGAFLDWQYHKAGGKPSSSSDRITFWVVTLLIGGAIALTEFAGWDPYGILGYVTVPLAAWLFLAWEIGRWRMRRKYPLPKLDGGPTNDS
jgi:purine-cytosine permease-like protein